MQHTATRLVNLFACIAALAAAAPTWASHPCEIESEIKLLSGDGTVPNRFGHDVDIDGSFAIVGADLDPTGGEDAGAAYIFKRSGDTWVQAAQLLASDAEAEDFFGNSVSISGDMAVVGAPAKEAAYIFTRAGDSWIETAKLTVAEDSVRFGRSVGIDGDVAIVGADLYGENNEGGAFIFTYDGNTWNETITLLASDADSNDWFGSAVAISGNAAIVGAYQKDDLGAWTGAAYIYQRSGDAWTEKTKLMASDASFASYFGYDVDISGKTCIVGAFGTDGFTGNAYTFTRTGGEWIETAKLRAGNAERDDLFGFSVAIDGDRAVVGAREPEQRGTVYAFSREGDTWTESAEISASDGAEDQQFGWTVAIDADQVMVGRWDEHQPLGAAYIYTIDCDSCDAIEAAKLIPASAVVGDGVGYSVGIAGDTAILGAPSSDVLAPGAGAAHVFMHTGGTWMHTQTLLTGNSFPANGFFGACVDISGDTLIIGAPGGSVPRTPDARAFIFSRNGDNWAQAADLGYFFTFRLEVATDGSTAIVGEGSNGQNGVSSGAASIYTRKFNDVWAYATQIFASDGESYDGFGTAVDVSGDTIVIGAQGHDALGYRAGAAYIFTYDGNDWHETQKLLTSDGAAGDWIGYSVAIDGDTLVIAGIGDDDNGTSSGSAYIFQRAGDTWMETAKLIASDGQENDFFGNSVDIDGDLVIVGARGDDDNGDRSGAAYVFKRIDGTWTEIEKVRATDADAGDWFGYSVAISGDHLVVGARFDEQAGENSGSAYVFDIDCTLAGDLTGDGVIDELDRAALCSALGASMGEPNYVASADLNHDGVIDELDLQLFNDILPPCDGDVVTSATFQPPPDGMTDGADLAFLLGAWASEPSCADMVTSKTFAPPPDGVVDGADLAFLLGAWGACE